MGWVQLLLLGGQQQQQHQVQLKPLELCATSGWGVSAAGWDACCCLAVAAVGLNPATATATAAVLQAAGALVHCCCHNPRHCCRKRLLAECQRILQVRQLLLLSLLQQCRLLLLMCWQQLSFVAGRSCQAPLCCCLLYTLQSCWVSHPPSQGLPWACPSVSQQHLGVRAAAMVACCS